MVVCTSLPIFFPAYMTHYYFLCSCAMSSVAMSVLTTVLSIVNIALLTALHLTFDFTEYKEGRVVCCLTKSAASKHLHMINKYCYFYSFDISKAGVTLDKPAQASYQLRTIFFYDFMMNVVYIILFLNLF